MYKVFNILYLNICDFESIGFYLGLSGRIGIIRQSGGIN